jgi:predicted DNA-binding transcriptional regulator YafY
MNQLAIEREDKALRLVRITSRFYIKRDYRPCNTELAQEFGCCVRTIRRDMTDLSRVLPLTKEHGRYRMMG